MDYYISIEAQNLGVRAGVNNAPLFVDDTGVGLKSVRPINEWIMPGDNKLTLFLRWPAGKEYAPGVASLKLSVWIADPKEPAPTPGQVLATFNWPPASPLPEVYPFIFAVPFIIPHKPFPMQLHTAEVVDEPTPGDIDQILILMRKMHDALAAKNAEAAADLLTDKFEDDAAANGTDTGRVRSGAITVYEFIFDQPDLTTSCVSRADLLLTPCCEHRLHHVGRLSQSSAITMQGAQTRLRIEAYVAKLQGVWKILR